MLGNEKYKGDAVLQKTYTVDYLTKEKRKNDGEVKKYFVENSHECCPYVNTFEPPQKARKMGVSCEFGIAHPHVEHLKTGRFLG
jgi:hypothetical protein